MQIREAGESCEAACRVKPCHKDLEEDGSLDERFLERARHFEG